MTATLKRAEPAAPRSADRTRPDGRSTNRRIRGPELAVGVLVMVGFALAAVLWHLSSVEKVPALAMVDSIARGQVIESTDLHVVYVASDDAIARMDPSRSGSVVGRVATVDLEAGALLTRTAVADGAAVRSGEAVVGLSLDPGAYPARGLAPGDVVNVVRSSDVAELDAAPKVIARDATVFAVEEMSSDRLLVSVIAPAGDAEVVAATAGAGGLRLVLVSS